MERRNQTNRSRRMSHETGYNTGNLLLKPGLRRLGWSIFFSSGRASTRSCFAVEGPLVAAVSERASRATFSRSEPS